jgi:tetratricopeptide (TPR) repeat protein
MTPERVRQIEDLYHAAREDRAVLAQADPDLRREVESLFAQDSSKTGMLDQPAWAGAEGLTSIDATLTTITPGTQLGPYKIEGPLGTGGMGQVFRAVDTRLGRSVAIKTSQAQFSERFEREARAISALNHPNICTLHDVGPNFLVMELCEGETLAARLKRGKLSIDDTVRYGTQIADALAAAHAKGIVHRDLKPGNIMVTKSGVKVLDFGLAKSSQDETITASRMVMGTPAYMAPEQREGKECDARTDIYSLGLVLYEMATGVRTAPDRLTPLESVSPHITHVIQRCLEQDPAERWQTASDVRRELEWAPAQPAPPNRRPLIWTTAAVLAVSVAGYFYTQRTPKLTDKDTIVLADFTNTTGDPVFDGTLRQGLAIQLEQSPFLSLVSEERIRKSLGLMGRPAEVRLTPALAREICQRTAGTAVLDGSIANLGSKYVVGLRAINCRTGDVIDEEQVQAARKEDVLNALSQIASKFRTRVGESLATVRQHDAPLAEATTPSLEALKVYTEAMMIQFSRGEAAALPLYKRATEIDPTFANAYAHLRQGYGDIGESELAITNASKAYQLRDRATDFEKYNIDVTYDFQVTGNLEKAQQTVELWAQTYPRLMGPHALLAGFLYPKFGKYEQAVEETKKVIELDPNLVYTYHGLSANYIYLDRLEDAERALQRASERKLEIPDLVVDRYDLAFLRSDKAGMEREASLSRGKSGVEDWIADREAFVLAYFGHLQRARLMSRLAADLARGAAKRESSALYETGAALREAFFGNALAARRSAMAALELSKGRDVEYGAAFALALSGDSSQPQILATDLERRFPNDTAVRFTYLPTLRALVALNHGMNGGRSSNAVELLQIAVPYELGEVPCSYPGFFGMLYPVYVRGLVYMTARQGDEAVREFQKILGHRGIVRSDPIGALARLQLGRAYVFSGDRTRAKAAYQDFLTLWKDADSDIPILQRAKVEYSKLQ